MNAAERIVEAYFRHVRGAFTRTSVRGVGQVELDIVAVDPNKSPMVFPILNQLFQSRVVIRRLQINHSVLRKRS